MTWSCVSADCTGPLNATEICQETQPEEKVEKLRSENKKSQNTQPKYLKKVKVLARSGQFQRCSWRLSRGQFLILCLGGNVLMCGVPILFQFFVPGFVFVYAHELLFVHILHYVDVW